MQLKPYHKLGNRTMWSYVANVLSMTLFSLSFHRSDISWITSQRSYGLYIYYSKDSQPLPSSPAYFQRTSQFIAMGIRLPRIIIAKQKTLQCIPSASEATNVPKGHFAVYVGETEKKRILVPISTWTFLVIPFYKRPNLKLHYNINKAIHE